MNFIKTGKKHVTSIHQLVSRQARLGYPKPLAALLELPMNHNRLGIGRYLMVSSIQNKKFSLAPVAITASVIGLFFSNAAQAEKAWVDPGAAQAAKPATPAAAPTSPAKPTPPTPAPDAAKPAPPAASEQHVHHMKARHKGSHAVQDKDTDNNKSASDTAKNTAEAPAQAKKKVVKIKPKAAPQPAPAAAPTHSNDLFPNLFNDE